MDKLDLREKGGMRDGQPQFSETRLFVQFHAWTNAGDLEELTEGLEAAGLEAVLYADVNDARGIGLACWSADPDYFITNWRPHLQRPEWTALTPKPEFAMLGRSYALGHEPDLEDWLLERPRRTCLAPEAEWAVWYPLRRQGAFAALPPEEQTAILREHGAIGHSFGSSGYAQDVRLACFGLDARDNDFVIGLLGPELYPLSACVQAMRRTRQTSTFIQQMGPFFVGRRMWQNPAVRETTTA